MKNLRTCFLLLLFTGAYLSSGAQSKSANDCLRLKGKELIQGDDKNIEAGGKKLVGKTKEPCD